MESPNAYVRLGKPIHRWDCFLWVIAKCPHCGKRHTHGAGDKLEKVEEFLGHRASHCFSDETKGYLLVRDPEDQ